MEFKQGDRVFVEGDAAEICTADFTQNISSWATVIEEPDVMDDYVLLSIDKIGGCRNEWVYVLKKNVHGSVN